MDFESKFRNFDEKLKEHDAELLMLKKQYGDAKEFTSIFLEVCRKYKIKKVSIATRTKNIPGTETFPFGVNGSVFTNEVRNGPWPAIWAVTEELNIGGGCGNSNQHSVSGEGMGKLIEGYYELRGGKWKLVKP